MPTTPCPKLPTTFHELLLNLLNTPEAATRDLLVSDEGQRWSAAGFVENVARLAQVLQAQFNLPAGSPVALLFWNQPEFFVALFALRLLGWVAVPVNVLMAPEDVAYVLRHADLQAVLGTESLLTQILGSLGLSAEQLGLPLLVANVEHTANHISNHSSFPSMEQAMAAAVLPQGASHWQQAAQQWPVPAQSANTLALMLYTSGTTGLPKGVMLSETNVLGNLAGFSQVVHLQAKDPHRFLLGLPVFHSYGLICALFALHYQATMVCVPKFQPKRLLAMLLQERISVLPLVPTLFTLLLQGAKGLQAEGKPFPHLQFCISGGAALPEPLLRHIETTLQAPVLEGYGLTETSPVIAVNSLTAGSIASAVGQVLPNVGLRLVCPTTGVVQATAGEPFAPATPQGLSEEGEIQVQGPNIMLGYYKQTEETTATFTADGWLKTGDLVRLDAKGNLYISGGRLKDLIIRAGENTAPLPIERVLAQHPAVQEVAVIPQPHRVLGEAILACVALKEGSLVVNSSQGGGTWFSKRPRLALSYAPLLACTCLPTRCLMP